MGMPKSRREYMDIVRDSGFEVERERPGKGGHRFLYARHVATGRKVTITISGSPSDHRSAKNFAANLRRMANEQG